MFIIFLIYFSCILFIFLLFSVVRSHRLLIFVFRFFLLFLLILCLLNYYLITFEILMFISYYQFWFNHIFSLKIRNFNFLFLYLYYLFCYYILGTIFKRFHCNLIINSTRKLSRKELIIKINFRYWVILLNLIENLQIPSWCNTSKTLIY